MSTKNRRQHITGCTVVQHRVNGDVTFLRRMGNGKIRPHRIESPAPNPTKIDINLEYNIYDCIREICSQIKFGEISSVNTSAEIGGHMFSGHSVLLILRLLKLLNYY